MPIIIVGDTIARSDRPNAIRRVKEIRRGDDGFIQSVVLTDVEGRRETTITPKQFKRFKAAV